MIMRLTASSTQPILLMSAPQFYIRNQSDRNYPIQLYQIINMTPTLLKIYIYFKSKITEINNYSDRMKTVQLFHPRASFESFAREKARERD